VLKDIDCWAADNPALHSFLDYLMRIVAHPAPWEEENHSQAYPGDHPEVWERSTRAAGLRSQIICETWPAPDGAETAHPLLPGGSRHGVPPHCCPWGSCVLLKSTDPHLVSCCPVPFCSSKRLMVRVASPRGGAMLSLLGGCCREPAEWACIWWSEKGQNFIDTPSNRLI